MSKMQRTKGASYERVLAKRFQYIYPGARRGIGQARSAKEVPDVDGTPWWVEAKHQKCPNLWAALSQAEEATDQRVPLVVARRNGGAEVAVMRLEAFLVILAELENNKKAALHWNEKYHERLNGQADPEEPGPQEDK